MKNVFMRDLFLLRSYKKRYIVVPFILSLLLIFNKITKNNTEVFDIIYALGGIHEIDAKENSFINMPYLWQIFEVSNIFIFFDFFREDMYQYGQGAYIKAKKNNFFTSKILCSMLIIFLLNCYYFIFSMIITNTYENLRYFSILILGQIIFLLFYYIFSIFMSEVYSFILVFLISCIGWGSSNNYFPANFSMPIQVMESANKSVFTVSIYYVSIFVLLTTMGNLFLKNRKLY